MRGPKGASPTSCSSIHPRLWWVVSRIGWLPSFAAAIVDGRLPAGSRLPPSRVLAAELQVSRGVVTEAYQRLSENGQVVGNARAGTVVASVPLPAAGDLPVSTAGRATPDLFSATPGGAYVRPVSIGASSHRSVSGIAGRDRLPTKRVAPRGACGAGGFHSCRSGIRGSERRTGFPPRGSPMAWPETAGSR